MAEVIYTCTQTLWDVCALGHKSKKTTTFWTMIVSNFAMFLRVRYFTLYARSNNIFCDIFRIIRYRQKVIMFFAIFRIIRHHIVHYRNFAMFLWIFHIIRRHSLHYRQKVIMFFQYFTLYTIIFFALSSESNNISHYTASYFTEVIIFCVLKCRCRI